jgi:phospholipase/carboxylesterase
MLRILLLVIAATLGAWSQPPLDPLNPNIGDFLDADATVLTRRGDSAYQAGAYLDAAANYLVALRADPSASNTIYNLACCYGLLKRDTLAALYLARAARAGFDEVEHVRRDPDFDPVRHMPVFTALVDSLEAALAAAEKTQGELVHVRAGALLPCRVFVPEGWDSTRAYPLVVGLHGYGASAKGFARIWQRFGNPRFIYAVPETPYMMMPGREPGYSWYPDLADTARWPEAAQLTQEYVLAVADELGKRFKVTERWLLGFSQGCGLAYATAISHPGAFTGIGAFGGWLDDDLTDEQVAAAKSLAVFIAHGREDRMVEFKAATAARERLKKHGYRLRFEEFAGGHTVPAELARKFADWVAAP